MTSNPASVGPAPDGEWIEWGGGENPVPGQMVEWKSRAFTGTGTADGLGWGRDHLMPIIAYRIAPHPDREAEPTGGVVDAMRLQRLYLLASDLERFDPWKGSRSKQDADDLRAALEALSVSPPVVEVSSAEGADTHRAAGWPVHVFTGHGDLEQQRQQARASETYKRGDMVMAWVNEGDLYANSNVVLEAARHQPTTPGEQDIEDVISDAIGDSMDMDWTYRDGAKAIKRAFEREGWVVMQNDASNPPVDAELGIKAPGEQGEEG